jgi:hypothetical protein
MYNCFSNRLCNNIKIKLDEKLEYLTINPETGEKEAKEKNIKLDVNAYDTNYKIYMLPVKLFENYTIAIDCYQGVELFCGFYNEKLDTSAKAKDLIKRTYQKIPKTLFHQPFIYDKLNVEYWNWYDENIQTKIKLAPTTSIFGTHSGIAIRPPMLFNTDKILRSEIAMRESELKLFIKVPANNTSSITVLEGDYHSHNDSIYTVDDEHGWRYFSNSAIVNFETKNCRACKEYLTCNKRTEKTCKNYSLPELNAREFKPISKLQLLALNTGISYPFADRLIEYLLMNVIVPNDATPDNIKRLQKVMTDCGYTFQIDGIWEPKMQMILYDYLMNSGKFIAETEPVVTNTDVSSFARTTSYNNAKSSTKVATRTTGKVKDLRTGNLKQMGQKMRSDFYDILGYGDKDAEKLYASWTTKLNEKTGTHQVVAKNTLENVDIYGKLYNN